MSQAANRPGTSAPAKDFAEDYRVQRQDELLQVLVAFVLAVAEVLGFYLVLSVAYQTPPLDSCLGSVRDVKLPWLVAVVLSRGLLQPLNLVVFAFAANALAIRLLMMPKESRAFSHSYFTGIPTDPRGQLVIGEEVRAVPLRNVRRIAEGYSGSLPLLVRRMETGSQRLAAGGTEAEIHDLMQAVSEIDRENLESRFTLVRYLIWLIPTVGFLGTVIGIGMAITKFSGVISQLGGGTEDYHSRLQGSLMEVAGDLGLAFDTTMLALLLSAILVALTSIVQRREEGLLLSVNEFCLRYFVSNVRVPDPSGRVVQEVAVGLTSLGQSMEHLARHVATEDSKDHMTLRDIAGLIEGQVSELKKTVIESSGGRSRSTTPPEQGGLT